jgi:hypothetical protein
VSNEGSVVKASLALSLGLASLLAWEAASVSAQQPTATDFIAVTATFETVTSSHRGSHRLSWRLVRSGGRVDHEGLDDRWVDIWRAGRGSELSLLKLAEPERTSIEYTSGQLRALRYTPSWHELNAVLPAHPRELGLRRIGAARVQGSPAERYTGTRGDMRISLTWLPREQLPHLLVIRQGSRTTRVRLLALARGPTSVRRPRELSTYRRLDAADLGDMEGDAFVHRHHARLHLAARRE